MNGRGEMEVTGGKVKGKSSRWCWLHYIAYHSWRWRERDVAQPARSIGGMWGGDR